MLNMISIKIAFALTSKGDLQKKLDFTFTLYDLDNNGTLTREEVKAVVVGMLDLLVIIMQ